LKRNIQLSKEAELDLIAAVTWYEIQREGLGTEFELSIEACLFRIARLAQSHQIRYKNTRVAFIGRFPYGIHYFIEEDKIFVIAIFHMSRDPERWGERE